MKKIICLIMFLSACMTVNLYAQSKKELKEINANLQHQADSLVGVTNDQALQIQELQRQIDSITNINSSLNIINEQFRMQNEFLNAVNQQLADINKQLSAQIEEKAEQRKKAVDQEEAKAAKEKSYIENKKYYPTENRQYCEEIPLCQKWASNMAKVSGSSFKIVDIQLIDNSYGQYFNGHKTRCGYVLFPIQYLLNNVAYQKTLKCDFPCWDDRESCYWWEFPF